MNQLPLWLNTLITAAISALATTIVSLVLKYSITHHLNKRDKKLEELEALKHEARERERKKEMIGVFDDSIKPVVEKVDRLDNKVDQIYKDQKLDKQATIVTMRVKMMELHDRYMERGYCNSGEKSTWHELYNKYKELGGNHFREYVDQYKTEIEMLPDKDEKR